MERAGLSTLFRVTEYVRRKLNHELPIQQLSMLLLVARKEGITQYDMTQVLNMPQGSTSRNVKLLSTYIANGERRGYGLLRCEPDLEERRRLAVFLTRRGREFVAELERLMGDARP